MAIVLLGAFVRMPTPSPSPRALIDAGRYAEAEAQARLWLTQFPDSTETIDLLVEALWRGGKAAQPETQQLAARALQLEKDAGDVAVAAGLYNRANIQRLLGNRDAARLDFEQALVLRERARGATAREVAQSLAGLAASHLDAGDLAGALALFERALQIRQIRNGPRAPETAQAMNNVAAVLRLTGDNGRAADLLTHAIRIWERTKGPDHPHVAQALENLAAVYRALGQPSRARPLLSRALSIKEHTLGAAHPSLADTLDVVADVARLEGRLDDADAAATRALTIVEQALGAAHARVGAALHTLGSIRLARGDAAGAQPLLRRALTIRESSVGPSHPDVADTLCNLALALGELGEASSSRQMFERALMIRREAFGPEHPLVADVLDNLGNAWHAAGDDALAQQRLGEALALRQRAFGARSPAVATSLHNIAVVLRGRGDLVGGQQRFSQAFSIRRELLGEEHPDTAASAHNLAGVLSELGDHREAKRYFARALAAREQSLGADHPAVAESLDGLADELFRDGDLATARGLYQRALEIRVRTLGPQHLLTAESHNNLGNVSFAAGRYDGAIDQYQRALALRRARLGDQHLSVAMSLDNLGAAYGARGDRARALELHRQALTVWGTHPESAWTWAAIARLLLAGEERAAAIDAALIAERIGRTALRDTARKSTERVALQFARERSSGMDVLLRIAAQRPSRDELTKIWDALIQSRGAVLDEAVRRARDPDEASRQQVDAGLAQVSHALPHKTALIAYARSDESYLAFVLDVAGEARVVNLGARDTIDEAVQRWRTEIDAAPSALLTRGGDPERRCHRAGDALRLLVWDPLASLLQNADLVLLVPDGALQWVAFGALPADETQFLVETAPTLQLLAAERDVLVPPPQHRGAGLLAVADPQFAAGSNRRALPGTREEAADIAQSWRAQPHAGDATVLQGASATKQEVLRQAPGHRVLHFATHGYVDDVDDPVDALRHSGIVLAGDSRASLLTAEELATLDLSSVDWVVLSACDTARGSLHPGEGVLGLRRALHVAGARTSITSLWPVPDASTRVWMHELYAARLRGESTAQAMRAASLHALAELRAAGSSTHPFRWGAFVAAGDWR